jgi:Oxidoreductase family, C-terminal alpha/beta domain/Oxidoreductase family, NAD-binding Rossmann fold
MSEPLSDRRAFLGGSAAALGYFFTADALSATRAAETPSETIRFAGIGVGGKGQSDILNAARVGHVVALCDIDEKKMNDTLNFKDKKSKNPQPPLSESKPRMYSDFRKMFDEIGKEIDAVTVSTADHSHAIASVTAMRLKKHVYCQKPLCHNVWEARLMRETAKKYGVCTQMGNQGSAENGLRRAIELVQDGLLGKIKEIHVWTNRPIWPQGPDAILKVGAAKAAAYAALHQKDPGQLPYPEVPKTINWDVFLGPAPVRAYDPIYASFSWRGWWDFGTGALGDMACHTANMAFRACELGSPTTIEADATDVNPETCPTSAKIKYTYPARGDKPHQAALDFYWYEGVNKQRKLVPPRELLSKLLKPGDNLSDSGSIIVGEKAILFSPNDYGAEFRIVGEVDVPKNLGRPERLPVTETRNNDLAMKEEWARAIRENKPEIAFSNFEIAGMLTEAILLGNVAIRVGKKLEFDAVKLQCPNNKDAAQYIKREYRKGWDLSERA